MSKPRLTNREKLQKLLKEAEADSTLHEELLAVKSAIEKPNYQAVTTLIKLLGQIQNQSVKELVAKIIASTKDNRATQALLRAAGDSQNEGYRANYLWPLERNGIDCTQYVSRLVNLLVTRTGFDEMTWVCIELIRKMEGPFEPMAARKCVRKLLAEIKQPLSEKELISTHANRLEAADVIMCAYFNQTRRTYWKKWNKGEWHTEDS
ncbi:HEAT repeat domain-containing protein [Hymenobacter convexus]|uniref:HEAT repeat domain-containing protein n=1 Tax=Hymenobacter sp. CA1UV-4 TaxID=3063782 RepID=UPI002712FEF6|nr:HEAT repeat domain-containing protein [Hymenobacter sp. CA1UV-4]MDO7852681.1 HEAT repeat domain-containing protein [Hymenobacter sp. CA1UV-4]